LKIQSILSYHFEKHISKSFSFEPYWFTTVHYATKQPLVDRIGFSFKDDTKEGFMEFYAPEGEAAWISPFRAPFGGPEFSENTDVASLFAFLKDIVAVAKEEGVKKIKLTMPPECYNLNKADKVDEVVLHLGFKVSITELNYHIDTAEGAFERLIAAPERRKISKCLEAGFTCIEESNPNYKEVYDFIAACRSRRGFPLSISFGDFEKQFLSFPDRYKLFSVKDGDIRIATAVAVIVSSEVVYNFLGSDHEAYSLYSPTVLLNQVIYEYSRVNGYRIYDLGIGTANGIRNEGLIKFKEHIGGKLSHKYSYELVLL
jgi:hypothetical protein